MRGRPFGAMRRAIVHPTPAGLKRRWPARWELKLAGPRVYGETLVDDAFMGEGRREAGAAEIRQALRLYRRACAIQALSLAAAVVIVFVGSAAIGRGQ